VPRLAGEDRQQAGVPAARPWGPLVTAGALPESAGAQIVIEAVTERLPAKIKALGSVCRAVAPGTPLVSCSSGIPVEELADWCRRPADLVGAHFTSPAHLYAAVEVSFGPRTGRPALDAVCALLTRLGRRPVPLSAAGGSVAARVLYPMINQAARIAAEQGGDAAEAVDALLGACPGQSFGPLRTADLIGIDTLVDTLEALHARTGNDRFRPCEALLAKVDGGELGRKSGRGFYGYDEEG
jgi:methoxymalonate biosynthesis protein